MSAPRSRDPASTALGRMERRRLGGKAAPRLQTFKVWVCTARAHTAFRCLSSLGPEERKR